MGPAFGLFWSFRARVRLADRRSPVTTQPDQSSLYNTGSTYTSFCWFFPPITSLARSTLRKAANSICTLQ